jgi:hypothetical protein
MVQWVVDDPHILRHTNSPAYVRKHQDRSYSLIDYPSHETRRHDEMFRALVRCGVELPQVSQVTRAVSDSGDSGCLVVDFTEYDEFVSASDREIFHQSLK